MPTREGGGGTPNTVMPTLGINEFLDGDPMPMPTMGVDAPDEEPPSIEFLQEQARRSQEEALRMDREENELYNDGSRWLEDGEVETRIEAKVTQREDENGNVLTTVEYANTDPAFIEKLMDQRVRKLMAQHCGNMAGQLKEVARMFSTREEIERYTDAYEIFSRVYQEMDDAARSDTELRAILSSCEPTIHHSTSEEHRGFWMVVCTSNTPYMNQRNFPHLEELHKVMSCAQEMPLIARAQLEVEYKRDALRKMKKLGKITQESMEEQLIEPENQIPTRKSLKQRFTEEELDRKEILARTLEKKWKDGEPRYRRAPPRDKGKKKKNKEEL